MARVPNIVPCICVDHIPGVEDSCYYGMPQLKVSVGFDTSRQFYVPFCPNCGRGGCIEYKSPYLALKGWNELMSRLWSSKEVFVND